MTSITNKIVINSPVEKVFQFVTSPDNWTKYVTSLVDVRDVSSPNVEKGTTFSWKYRMVGIDFGGKGSVIENEKNSRFGLRMEGGLPNTEHYTFTTVNGGTELSVEIKFDIPGKVMNVITKSSLVQKLNQKEAEGVLEKIKMMCEEL